MTTWQMYWLVKLDDIGSFCTVIAVLGGVLCSVGWVFRSVFDREAPDAVKRLLRIVTGPVILAMLLAVLLPSTKQLAAIILVPKLVNSEMIQHDVPQVYDLAVEWMKAKLAVPEKAQQ